MRGFLRSVFLSVSQPWGAQPQTSSKNPGQDYSKWTLAVPIRKPPTSQKTRALHMVGLGCGSCCVRWGSQRHLQMSATLHCFKYQINKRRHLAGPFPGQESNTMTSEVTDLNEHLSGNWQWGCPVTGLLYQAQGPHKIRKIPKKAADPNTFVPTPH